MKRATFTQFRDPREMTPSADLVKVTNTGAYLFNSEVLTSPISIGKEKRFIQHTVDKTDEPGPDFYSPKTQLIDRIKSKGCFKITKPILRDEHLYDIVNGTQRVLS